MLFSYLKLPKKAMIVTAILLLSTAYGQADEITLRADPWCPYNCEPGPAPGFMVEIAREVFENAGHSVDYRLLNWARAKKMLAAGQITGVVGMTLTEDSKDKWVFPEIEQGREQFCFFAPVGTAWTYTGMASLSPITLGAINGYGYGPELSAYIRDHRRTRRVHIIGGVNALQDLIKLLALGRVDAVIEDQTVMGYALKQSGLSDRIREAGCRDVTGSVYVVFSLKDPRAGEYARLMAEGTRRLRASGKLRRILDKYQVKDWR